MQLITKKYVTAVVIVWITVIFGGAACYALVIRPKDVANKNIKAKVVGKNEEYYLAQSCAKEETKRSQEENLAESQQKLDGNLWRNGVPYPASPGGMESPTAGRGHFHYRYDPRTAI